MMISLPLVVVAFFWMVATPTFAFVSTDSVTRGATRVRVGSALGLALEHQDTILSSPDNPIVVIGGTGKVGRIITQLLVAQKHHVRAVSRTGRPLTNIVDDQQKDYITYAKADVTNSKSIEKAITPGAAAVIWAATSPMGGSAFEVDYKGAYYTAKACVANEIPKLVFLSAGCVTRPKSLGFRAVNFVTQWAYGEYPFMDSKMAGEDAVRDLYSGQKKSAYVIVRGAAALSDKPPIPASKLVVMQGDMYTSAASISRTNVAQMVVSALLSGKATDFCTFEVAPAVQLYQNDEANILDILGLPSWTQTMDPDLPEQLFHRNTRLGQYEDLLQGLLTDEEMRREYGSSILSNYPQEGGLKELKLSDSF